MKVNLSYSVDLDEVLSSAEKLYLEAKALFEKNYNVLAALRAPEFTDAKLETTTANLRNTHATLAQFAARLEEIQGILTGYQGVVDQELRGPEPEEPTPPPEYPPYVPPSEDDDE